MKFSWQILGLALIKDVIRKYLYNILCVSLFKIYCVYDINLYRANHGCSRRHFNPFIPSGIFYLSLWTGPFLTKGVCFAFLVLSCFTEISVFNANSVDPNQMPCCAASDLDLHCLPMSPLWDIRHKRVNFVLNFQRKYALKFHVNCPSSRQFTENAKSYFLSKNNNRRSSATMLLRV